MTQTSELIHRLGREAVQGRDQAIRFGTILLAASAVAFGLSLGVILLVFHARLSVAATLGGAAYAIACRNNGLLFFLVWYGLSIFLVSLAGAGRRRWQLCW